MTIAIAISVGVAIGAIAWIELLHREMRVLRTQLAEAAKDREYWWNEYKALTAVRSAPPLTRAAQEEK